MSNQMHPTETLWQLICLIAIVCLCIVIVLLLVTLRKMRRESISGKFMDEETGMGNLKYFQYHFRYTLGDLARNLYSVAYIILDSSYLDTYHKGTSFAEVLKYAAQVLSRNVGDGELSARITENGFALALQCADEQAAQKRLQRILEELNDFERSNHSKEHPVFHAAYYRLHNTDKNCEMLLYSLRENCNSICTTTDLLIACDMSSMNKLQAEKKMTDSIAKGLQKNEFKMYLQFSVDNKTKEIVSAEALSRWEHPENGLILPGKYINYMERFQLISQHDFYIFELVCKQLQSWKNTEFSHLSISCNFTRITLSEEDFVGKICSIAERYQFNRNQLAIEITENAMEKNMEVATQNVQKCKELGFTVYLDDLGSGYTTLANLCDYPIDVVKIDRSILLKTNTNRGRELLLGIVALAHSLKMQVICEGVETEEQNTWISSTDCDVVQGWYYSKGLPAEQAEDFLKDYRRKQIS